MKQQAQGICGKAGRKRLSPKGSRCPEASAFAYSPFEVVLRLPRPFYHDKHSLSQKWILRDHIKVVTLALKVRMFSSRNLIFTHLTHTQPSLLNALLPTQIPPHTHLGYHRSKDSTSVCAQSLSRVRLFETPMDCSPPGSSVHGILQARILEWVAISYPWGSSWPRDRTHISCVPCIGRQVLYHWVTGEGQASIHWDPTPWSQPQAGAMNLLSWVGLGPWPLPTADW